LQYEKLLNEINCEKCECLVRGGTEKGTSGKTFMEQQNQVQLHGRPNIATPRHLPLAEVSEWQVAKRRQREYAAVNNNKGMTYWFGKRTTPIHRA